MLSLFGVQVVLLFSSSELMIINVSDLVVKEKVLMDFLLMEVVKFFIQMLDNSVVE